MALDVSNDYLYFDWKQAITYYVRRNDGTFDGSFSGDFSSDFNVALTISNTLHREQHKGAITNGVDFSQVKTIWEIWVADNVSIYPKRGDAFIDSNTRAWLVEDVDYCDRISRFRLHCMNTTHLIGSTL